MALAFQLTSCNKDEDIIIDNSQENPSQSLGFKVLDYTPAPGQYINDRSNGSAGITNSEDACRYAESRFLNSQYVSLGAWGGYIIVKFDESVINSGSYDFSIGSNSFDTSNEPGIVWVMQDANANGVPDDEWFELKGSYFLKDGYQRDYWMTYTKPEAKQPTPWVSKDGESGTIQWLGNYHSQDYYYPEWIKEESITFHGSLLPSQAFKDDAIGMWTNGAFDWGYADNFGSDFNPDGRFNQFKISDAVDSDNNPVELESIDFVKVQTAIKDNAGWLGEISTEVTGFYR